MENAGMLPTLLRTKQNGRTQRDFARELGVSQGLLSGVLNGKYRLGPSAARRIAARHPDLGLVLANAVAEAVLTVPPTKDAA